MQILEVVCASFILVFSTRLRYFTQHLCEPSFLCFSLSLLQYNQPGHAVCHAQFQDAPAGQRESGAGLQNAQ